MDRLIRVDPDVNQRDVLPLLDLIRKRHDRTAILAVAMQRNQNLLSTIAMFRRPQLARSQREEVELA